MTGRIAFNGLSVSNLSGAHVLMGHIEQVLEARPGRLEPLLVHRDGDDVLPAASNDRIKCVPVKISGSGWFARRLAERKALPGLLESNEVRVLFQPDGLLAPVGGVRQWVLAQNPWCFFHELHQGPGDRLKAFLQRRAYAQAQRKADFLFYNSRYMADAYEALAGVRSGPSKVLHQGVAEDAFARGLSSLPFGERREEIVVVSAFAPHKNIEAVVRALGGLRDEGVDADLTLVGGWPDSSYQERIRASIRELDLVSRVTFVGHVDRAALLDHYARARVFCLFSRCESFGIPAIEAQACGTPTVIVRGTAAPEIAGPGGLVTEIDDDGGAVRALSTLLQDAEAWEAARTSALHNAERFRWSECSRPLLEVLAMQEPSSC